jgi:hypothetical protein
LGALATLARWFLIAAFMTACTAATSSAPAGPPELLAIGRLAKVDIAEPQRRYFLTDGRIIDISTMTTRIVFAGGGPGEPIVHGRDAQGDFIAIFATQAGLPPDCHLPGIGATGVDRGDYVEIAGILWRKAIGFEASEATGSGQAYPPSTRFCFNDQAELTSTLP